MIQPRVATVIRLCSGTDGNGKHSIAACLGLERTQIHELAQEQYDRQDQQSDGEAEHPANALICRTLAR